MIVGFWCNPLTPKRVLMLIKNISKYMPLDTGMKEREVHMIQLSEIMVI
jgi:hypothetical protein